jgi:hypothetical protein
MSNNKSKPAISASVTKNIGNGDFCSVTCTIEELEAQISKLAADGDLLSSEFLKGVRFHRRIVAAATGGDIS